ncbi:MAG TPA: hypothetical protein VJB05_03970 [archaeon]|nr:hypothetical protein [archaeon]
MSFSQQDAKKLRRQFNDTYPLKIGQTINVEGRYLSFYGISATLTQDSLQLSVLGYPTAPKEDAIRLPANIVYRGRNVHIFTSEMKKPVHNPVADSRRAFR